MRRLSNGLTRLSPAIYAVVFSVCAGLVLFVAMLPAHAADTITSAQYLDNDGNGRVDTIRWTMDETVTGCTYEAGDWTVDTSGSVNVSSITGVSCTGSDANLDIQVSTSNNGTGGPTDPVISYTDQGTLGDIVLASGNMTSKPTVTATDGAAPQITRFLYKDVDLDGRIDTIALRFTEVIDAGASTMSANDLVFTNVGVLTDAAFGADTNDVTVSDASEYDVTLGTEATVVNTRAVPHTELDISTQNAFSVTDGTNTNNTLGDQTASWLDSAAAVIKDVEYRDTDGDGAIDHVLLTYSEPVTSGSFLSANDLAFSNVGDFTGAAFGTDGTDLITGSTSTTLVPLGTEATALDTSEDSGNIAIDSQNSFSLNDFSGNVNTALGTQTQATFTDGAAPVVLSTAPTSGATDANVATDVVLEFSEAMDTTFVEGTEFTFSPDPGTFTTSSSTDDSMITIDPDTDLECDTSYTVTTDEAEIDAASGSPTGLLTTGPETGDFSFTTACRGTGSALPHEEEEKTYEVNVLTPNGGETWEAGSVQEITWETSGTGTISFVNVYYSTDAGASYTLIEKNSSNDGSLDWTLPTTGTADGIVKVAGTDLATEMAADSSDSAFTIQVANGETTEEPAEEPQEPPEEEMGTSPVTGEPEPITPVSPGDYITSPSFSTVYYVDADMIRHPFYDKQTYFTWQDSFDVVKDVTDATLPTLTLGTPIMPKPGVALVKITTAFDVFAVTQGDSMLDSILRKIDNEDVATALYGAQWADYVIDIPTTLFEQFDRGPVIDANSTFNPDMSIMKTRMELNE